MVSPKKFSFEYKLVNEIQTNFKDKQSDGLI